jgi:predicted nucleic acid-binding protein
MIRVGRRRELVATGGKTSVQVLNEFVAVLRRKWRWSWVDIDEALAGLRDLLDPPLPLTMQTHEAAMSLARQHNFNIYDALIVAAALRAKCRLLLTEDMADGMTIGELTIRNPFRAA